MMTAVGVCAGPSCARELVAPARGRTPTYCSGRCRTAAHRARQLPVEMRTADRWVRWMYQGRGDRITKRPITTRGASAASTRPQTWTSLDAVKASPRGDGIGFVLGDGIGGIDVDGVIDADGDLHPSARELLDLLGPTYIEMSPSGRGLHLIGAMSPRPGRVVTWRGIKLEIYPRARFFTVSEKPAFGSTQTLGDLDVIFALLDDG